jgi:hypothetical protein
LGSWAAPQLYFESLLATAGKADSDRSLHWQPPDFRSGGS